MNFAGVNREDDFYEVAIRDGKERVLFYDTRCDMDALAGYLSTWDVGVCVMDGFPEPSDVTRLREHLVLKDIGDIQIWPAVFVQKDAGEFPVYWDFELSRVEVDRTMGDPLGEAGILSRAALQRPSVASITELHETVTEKTCESTVREYVVRVSGGREIAERAGHMQVMDGCLVLEREGRPVAAWGAGAWEWVRLAKEANSDEAI